MSITARSAGSSQGITLTPSGFTFNMMDSDAFQIQTITKNNIKYIVTLNENANKHPVFTYYDENGIPLGTIKMAETATLNNSGSITNNIDYILVRDDAILIFDKNNKLLGVLN